MGHEDWSNWKSLPYRAGLHNQPPSFSTSLLLAQSIPSALPAASQTHHACFCRRILALMIPLPGTHFQSYAPGSPSFGSLLKGYLIRKDTDDNPYKTILSTDSHSTEYPHTMVPYSTCYGQNFWVPTHSYVEAITPRVAALGDVAFMEVNTIKRGTKIGTLLW